MWHDLCDMQENLVFAMLHVFLTQQNSYNHKATYKSHNSHQFSFQHENNWNLFSLFWFRFIINLKNKSNMISLISNLNYGRRRCYNSRNLSVFWLSTFTQKNLCESLHCKENDSVKLNNIKCIVITVFFYNGNAMVSAPPSPLPPPPIIMGGLNFKISQDFVETKNFS